MSASHEDTKAMEAILANLQKKTDENIAAAKAMPTNDKRVSSISDPSARAMADVLSKLEAATTSATQQIVESANVDTQMAISTERTATGVDIAGYEVVIEKKTVDKIVKNFYTIVEKSTGTALYSELGLFESAMSIVKRLMLDKGTDAIDRIVANDDQYTSALLESYDYKRRLKSKLITEAKADIYQAKYDAANEKMRMAKSKIIKTL